MSVSSWPVESNRHFGYWAAALLHSKQPRQLFELHCPGAYPSPLKRPTYALFLSSETRVFLYETRPLRCCQTSTTRGIWLRIKNSTSRKEAKMGIFIGGAA
jgi:hypothetical protein